MDSYPYSKHLQEKLTAAFELLTQETTTLAKFEKVRILLKGVNPRVDQLLFSCSQAVKKLKKIKKGEIIELTAENLPATTREEKERKKTLLLFISFWKNLQGEVKRLKNLYQEAGRDGQVTSAERLTALGKTVASARGPLGLITVAAVIIVAGGLILPNLTTEIVIKNQGCAPIVPLVRLPLPINLPGFKLPEGNIQSGEQSVVTVPALTVTVAGQNNLIVLSALSFRMEFNLQNPRIDLIFDHQSLLGKQTVINLGLAKTHELKVICPSKP